MEKQDAKIAERFSAAVLCGGKSSRMGREKAELLYRGVSFLDLQINKLRSIGIEDILIAGHSDPGPGTRPVRDVFPGKGPLSGIHAALQQAENERILVLAVDMPLLPAEHLLSLLEEENADAVLWSSDGRTQPLPGVYSKKLLPLCEEILQGNRTSVRMLLDRCSVCAIEYTKDPEYLSNCNTPEEYRRLTAR